MELVDGLLGEGRLRLHAENDTLLCVTVDGIG